MKALISLCTWQCTSQHEFAHYVQTALSGIHSKPSLHEMERHWNARSQIIEINGFALHIQGGLCAVAVVALTDGLIHLPQLVEKKLR